MNEDLVRESSDGLFLDRCVERMLNLHNTPGRRQDELLKRNVAEVLVLMMIADHEVSPTLRTIKPNDLAILIYNKYRSKIYQEWANDYHRYSMELWDRLKQEAEEREAVRRLLYGD